jgi:hypothetical protein
MRNYLIIIFLLIFEIIHAQEQNRGLRIYTNLLQNIDISHPRINVGIEKDFKNNQDVSFGLGFYYRNWMYSEPAKGLNYNLEYKKFFKNNFYGAFGANYGNLLYGDTTKNKSVYDIYLKMGKRIDIGHFYVDCFGGLGMRYKETRLPDNALAPAEPIDPNLQYTRDKEGNSSSPIIKLGLVFGVNFKK